MRDSRNHSQNGCSIEESFYASQIMCKNHIPYKTLQITVGQLRECPIRIGTQFRDATCCDKRERKNGASDKSQFPSQTFSRKNIIDQYCEKVINSQNADGKLDSNL